MDVDVREEDEKTVLVPSDRNHTLMTVLKQAVWDSGGKAGYNRGHPYEDDTGELVVEAGDTADAVAEAVEAVQDDLDTVRDAFKG